MPDLQNDRLLRALMREPVDRTPVWVMRQAGRYLPEYNQTRARAGSFVKLMKSPAMAAEVTLQPLARFDLDAAIVFSDILTVPDAMGLGLYFAEGEGPRFEHPLRDPQAIAALRIPDPATDLRYVMDAIAECRRGLAGKVPLIGFSGSPFTLACYMIEGGGSDDFARVKQLMYGDPASMHRLLDINARAVSQYLDAQIEAGAQAVMLFDTWGGMLSAERYREFSLRYLEQIVGSIRREAEGRRVPIIVFTKGGAIWLESIAAIGADAVGLDWTIDIGTARKRVGDRVALQGNLDPIVMLTDPATIENEVERILSSFGHGSGHVFNLGHGITRFTPPEHVGALVDAVHRSSLRFHATAGTK
ncbi:MAG: uroporphyrinogen decarboxylase [Proteobacteria bacterium]|nr:uroporphyrinogen decarboxylase [Burkholderiales bacterium]